MRVWEVSCDDGDDGRGCVRHITHYYTLLHITLHGLTPACPGHYCRIITMSRGLWGPGAGCDYHSLTTDGQPPESLRRWDSNLLEWRPNVIGVVRAYQFWLMCPDRLQLSSPRHCLLSDPQHKTLSPLPCNLFIRKIGLNRKIFEQKLENIWAENVKNISDAVGGNLLASVRTEI